MDTAMVRDQVLSVCCSIHTPRLEKPPSGERRSIPKPTVYITSTQSPGRRSGSVPPSWVPWRPARAGTAAALLAMRCPSRTTVKTSSS